LGAQDAAADPPSIPVLSEALRAIIARSAREFEDTGDWATLDTLAYEAAEGVPFDLNAVFHLPSVYGRIWSQEKISLTALGLAVAGTAEKSLDLMARLARICADRKLQLRGSANISRAVLVDDYGFDAETAKKAAALVGMIPGVTAGGQEGDDWNLALHRGALDYRGVANAGDLQRLLAEQAADRLRIQQAQSPIFSNPGIASGGELPVGEGTDPNAQEGPKLVPGTTAYLPRYTNSWALVIGINEYSAAAPLGYACSDAEAVAELLAGKFSFPQENITLLLNADASRAEILSSYLAYESTLTENDRLAVYFAGHGYTRTGRRGEVGYLVPHDGDPADLSTLIRWDELTRNGDLIPAKHVLFLMDACYGGLAITRALAPGSSRFLKDMLQRYSRQVLTAGKADEVVADAGGPRLRHSVFTGHLLDALEGAAEATDGIITANGVMAYVYDKVGKDPHSQQTPHYGFLDGDGDFVFQAPTLEALHTEQRTDEDVLLQVPATGQPAAVLGRMGLPERIKELLSDSRYRIALDDLVASEIRAAQYAFRDEVFPTQTPEFTAETFAERLRQYESASENMLTVTILIAKWGEEGHRPTLQRTLGRLADNVQGGGGLSIWNSLRWYPLVLLLYSGGISALSAGNYSNLATLLLARIRDRLTGENTQPAIVPIVKAFLEVKRTEAFKRLPGHERHFVPESEYLFKALQPPLEDALFLGTSYEDLFDQFEILQALVYAHLQPRPLGGVWGPIGRFGWKHRLGTGPDPFDEFVANAERQGQEWPALRAGFFAGSLAEFMAVVTEFRELLKHLPWY
ncbi:MAG: peptidase caspase catalytic subunit p20, partial [Actinobacteria bacterium]|nr:peptidase caspase catalytic subunit p20 [Actinomycetota bacterium]